MEHGAGTAFDQSPDVKRSKKTPEQTRQLQLATTTVKVLTNKDFTLINGGNGCGIKSGFCDND
jgi:hypothetical protein